MSALKIKVTKRRPRFVFVVCNAGHVHVKIQDAPRGACGCGNILWPDEAIKITARAR